MQNISEFRNWLVFSITFFMVALSYEFRLGNILLPTFPLAGILVASLVFAFGSRVSDYIVGFLLKSWTVRRMIAGRSFIEGYWHLKTAQPEGSKSALTQTGIACMQYDPSANDFKVETVRFDDKGDKYVTISEIAHVRSRGQTIRYLNCFRLTYPGPEDKIGLSFGQFAFEGELIPRSLEAHIAVAGEGISRRQSAERIPEDIVRLYKSKSSTNWMHDFIESDGKVPFE
ncbi:hypothetical protein ABWH89_16710 [Hoeflea alexandrii]|uniref:hypothetical protein n=1 Tax=Hoeflea alexandrii TaxID=288436 RepID=UPI0035D07CF1